MGGRAGSSAPSCARRESSAASLESLFVPSCSSRIPPNPLPSAGRVKTDGCLFNGMHELSEKQNSSPPHPGTNTRLL